MSSEMDSLGFYLLICGYKGASLNHRYLKIYLFHTELIMLLIVACGMLSHFSSIAVRNCQILVHTAVCTNPEHPIDAQWVTCRS